MSNGIIAAGIDVGSSTVQVALVTDRDDLDGPLLGTMEERIRRRIPSRVARHAFDNILAAHGLAESDVAYVASTGDDEAVPFRHGHFYGMTTHARGALFLDPEVRGALDVGALHSRAIVFSPEGRVERHRMTGQCASGSGQFLENISRYLGVTLDEVGPLSLQAQGAEPPSGICAVLAETDVINLVSRGVPTPDILRGLHVSVSQRLGRLLKAVKAKGPVLVTGGGSRDEGLLAVLRERLEAQGTTDIELRTHPLAPLAGAIGAGLWGLVRHRVLAEQEGREGAPAAP